MMDISDVVELPVTFNPISPDVKNKKFCSEMEKFLIKKYCDKNI